MDFPGGAVVRNPPDNAGDMGFEPWTGKIPHVTEQLSPRAPQILSPRATTTEARAGRAHPPQ